MRSTLPAFDEVWQRKFRTSVLNQFQNFSENTHFLIGCSGGIDSMLLLHLMSFLYPKKIRAIYVDHQLQDISKDWGEFVSQQCEMLGVPCIVEKVQVADGNLELQARNARYSAYKKHLLSHEILTLAHHQQDQAETVLLRLFSGTGVHGLAAMKVYEERTNFCIWRPFLELTREQICQWAEELNVQNILDPTNTDIHYDRAWCREELWPFLQNRFPKMQQAVSRTSLLMQDADEILKEIVQGDLHECGNHQHLILDKFQLLSQARQRQLLSAWMKGEEQYRPSLDMVERLQKEVIFSKNDAQAKLHWNHYYYVRYQNVLYRIHKNDFLAEQSQDIIEQNVSFQLNTMMNVLSGHYQIQTENIGLSFELLNQPLVIKPRIGGEKVHLYGRVGAWPLKKAIQEAQIFPWQRHTIQILSIDNVILGIFTPKGFWLAQSPYCETGGWQPNLLSQR
jgi:tRNA(Ile)-lysidine synthase